MSEFLQLMESWDKFTPIRGTPVNEAAIARTLDLVENRKGWPTHKWEYMLKEAITTSDFPYLFGQILDREVLARYKVFVADWKSYFSVRTLRDFRDVYRHRVIGIDERLPEVAEKGEYLVAPVSECRDYYHLHKYGRQFDISWEALINDDMGAFDDVPQRMANAAIRTEAFNATSTFVDANGPHASLFGAPIADCGQNVTNLGALALTIANLETTLELMAAQTDPNGEPIAVRGVHLVVSPSLEFTDRKILTSGLKQWTESAVGVPVAYPTTNVVSQVGMQLHIDPYIPVVDTSQNVNTWYVFGDPSQGAAMEFGYLRGHETPEICMKDSDKVSIGGGALSPFSGDFATDNVFYRVRIVKGSTQLDPRFAYAQVST